MSRLKEFDGTPVGRVSSLDIYHLLGVLDTPDAAPRKHLKARAPGYRSLKSLPTNGSEVMSIGMAHAPVFSDF